MSGIENPQETKVEKNGQIGRPPLPPELARSQRVVTFVTPREMKQINAIASDTGQSLSALAHELIRESLLRRQ